MNESITHRQSHELTRVGDPDRKSLRRMRRVFRFLVGSDPHPTQHQLEAIRRNMQVGDPLAEGVVSMYASLPPGQGRAVLDQALEKGIESIERPPAALVALFAQLDREPAWLDRDKLTLASDVSRRIGPSGELVLRNLSLMGGYLGAAAAKPLVFTGQLERVTARRLVETSKFWLDVTTRGGLERRAEGFKSTVRVRVMHAQVRAMLLKSDKWDMGWGYPLNQWDSMVTTLEFSVIFLTGLRALGFLFTRREREAIVHLWRYVGYLIGVDEEILPAGEADAMRALYHAIATVGSSDEDSRRLGQSLADVPLHRAGEGFLPQRLARIERTLRVGFSRYVLGDEAADTLGLPPTATKYLWPAQIPLRVGLELVRMGVPPIGRRLVRRYTAQGLDLFPQEVRATRADTSFTPVEQLAR
ncbi:MAG: oxygenase MpaB family protein [Polyangiaceae bacterium]